MCLRVMRRAGTNAPAGAAYNKAFGLWLDEIKAIKAARQPG